MTSMNPKPAEVTDKERRRNRFLPRRFAAKFTSENDHSPLVQQDCPKCNGSGKFCTELEVNGSPAYSLGVCDQCNGAQVTGRAERFFSNEAPAISIKTHLNHWIVCPICKIQFSTTDPNEWTGLRHKRCGQKFLPQIDR